MSPVEIYTTRYCPYCNAAKALLKRKGVTYSEIDVSRDWERRDEMIQRANGRMTVPQIFIGPVHVGGSDELHALERAGKLDPLLIGRRSICMTAGSFNAAMIQMRSSLKPSENIDDAVRMIGEAKAAGADYVLTPEMTNILAAKREQLFDVIADEESDKALATLRDARAAARHLHSRRLAGDQDFARQSRQSLFPC